MLKSSLKKLQLCFILAHPKILFCSEVDSWLHLRRTKLTMYLRFASATEQSISIRSTVPMRLGEPWLGSGQANPSCL